MERKHYPTDLTDKQWEIIEPLIPPEKPGGRPRKKDMREIMNALFYVARTGCAWRMLPHDFPKWEIVYHYFSIWSDDGTWKTMHDALRRMVRKKAGKNPEPTAGSIDSQSVKTTEKRGISMATMAARRSPDASAISSLIRSVSSLHSLSMLPTFRIVMEQSSS